MNRKERYELRLTPEEKRDWNTKAMKAGMDLSEYIRSCVERRKLSPALPPVNQVTAVELGRIGVNLNQQVRAMNTALASGQRITNIDEAMQRVEEVYKMVSKVQLDLLNNRKPKVEKAKRQPKVEKPNIKKAKK